MTVSRARGAKNKCDMLASKITRSKGFCQACGSTRNLQTMHIISRRYSNTRTDLTNLLCGCASCHRRFTDYPPTFGEFVRETIGQLAYDELVLKSNERAKMDWEEELIRLKAIWGSIEKAA